MGDRLKDNVRTYTQQRAGKTLAMAIERARYFLREAQAGHRTADADYWRKRLEALGAKPD